MPEHASFLGPILDAPDDDAPRLIYADWLEEQGEHDRAEFIRVQCALAQMPPGDERRPDLESRELRLLSAHRKEWARPLRSWIKACEFRRGLVEGVKLDAATFLEHAADLFRRAPIRHLHLVNHAGRAIDLAASKHLARIRSLALTDPRFTAGQHVRWVDNRRERGENPLGTSALRTLLGSRHLKELRALDVQNHCLGTAGVCMLAESPRLGQIEFLDLRNNDFAEGDIAILAGSRHLGALRRLRLASCFSFNNYDYWPDDRIGLVADEVAPLVGRLELLDLGSCGIMAAGLNLLAERKRRTPLVALLLERNPLGEGYLGTDAVSLPHLLAGVLLRNLHTLDLSSCYLSLEDIIHLAASPSLAGLVRLGLRHNVVNSETAAAIAASPHLTRLQRLEWAGASGEYIGDSCSLGDTGVRQLADGTGLPHLAALELRRNRISLKGARALAKSALSQRLYWLDLRQNQLGNLGASALMTGDWPRLAWLDVRDNGIGTAACHALRQRFGHAVRF